MTSGILRTIVGAVAVYAVALTSAWHFTSVFVNHKSRSLANTARANFGDRIGESLNSVMWYISTLIMEDIGHTAVAVPTDKLRQLAVDYAIDEINIISNNGITIATTLDDTLGYDFHDKPETAAFMRLFDPGSNAVKMNQPFRHGASNPRDFCKYHATVFFDRSGFIQLGYSMDRLVSVMGYSDVTEYARWRFGRYGHYKPVDEDHDHLVDSVESLGRPIAESGEHSVAVVDGLKVYRLMFPYAGRLFWAVVPEREFGELRTNSFVVLSIVIGIIVVLFAIVLIRLSMSSDKLERLHREADERTAADLAVARTIQMSSLPKAERFKIDDFSFGVAAVTYPAREVGGDFYDFFQIPDGRIAFVVGDVSGKGVPAAMFMHVVKNTLHSALMVDGDLADAVAETNDYLCRHNDAEMFVTLFVAVLDTKTGDVEYVNAGHNRPYVIRKDLKVERLDVRGGRFLGMFPKSPYRSARTILRTGERLFAYTDGVTEAMNAARCAYGDDRLVSILSTASADMCSAVKEDVDMHAAGAERSDDMTMLSLTWYGEPSRVERVFPCVVESAGEAVKLLQENVKFVNRSRFSRLVNAVDEIVANVISYSGADTFSLMVESVPGRCCVTVSDSGAEYDPLGHKDPDVHQSLTDRPIGGLGILMTKKLVDSVVYRRTEERNVLTMVQVDFDGKYRQSV